MAAAKTENAIRRVRDERGIAQGELASLAGISRQALSEIESGRSCPSTAVALRLSKALHCGVEDLFQLAEDGDPLLATWVRRDRALGSPQARMARGGRGRGAADLPSRVALGFVAGRWVAHPLAAEHPASMCIAADGLAREGKGAAV